jgi:hypothetical protein
MELTLQEVIFTQTLNKLYTFIAPRCSLPCLQESFPGPYTEWNEFQSKISNYIVTRMTPVRQRLRKHVHERYAVNKNRRPLLDNGFGYHGTKHVSDTTDTWWTVLEPLEEVISVRFSRSYKRRAVCQKN